MLVAPITPRAPCAATISGESVLDRMRDQVRADEAARRVAADEVARHQEPERGHLHRLGERDAAAAGAGSAPDADGRSRAEGARP